MFYRKMFIFLAYFCVFLSYAYNPLDSGVCECLDCFDCCSALDDNTNCYAKVILGGDMIDVTTAPYCIVSVNFNNKIFDCQGYLVDGDKSGEAGILLNNNENSTIQNCRVSDFSSGIGLNNSLNNTIINNTVYDTYWGFIISNQSSNNTVINNTVYNSVYQIYLENSSNNSIFNNIFNATGSQGVVYDDGLNFWNTTKSCTTRNILGGICIGGNFYSNYLGVDLDGDGIGDDPPNYSIYGGSNLDYLPLATYNGCVNLSNPGTYQNKVVNVSGVFYVNRDTVLCTDTYSTTQTLLIINSSDIYLDCNNSILDGDSNGIDYGINLSSKNNVNISNCFIQNFYYGFYLRSSYNNTLSNNVIYNTTNNAITLGNSNNNTIANNTINSTRGYGIYLSSSHNTILSNNVIYNTTNNAITLGNSNNNTIANNTLNTGNYLGISLSSSSYNSLINNTAYGNQYYSLWMNNTSDVYVENDHYYNNINNIRVIGPVIYNLTNVSIDNPNGGYENYTTISVYDNVAAGEQYYINWSKNSTALPTGKVSFANKFIDITTVAGTPSIEMIKWHWLESELTGYDESRFSLWKYNSSGWTLLNNTPDTTNNELSLTNMTPASIYGILLTPSQQPRPPTPGGCDKEVIIGVSTDCSTDTLVVNVSREDGIPLANMELLLYGNGLSNMHLITNNHGLVTSSLPETSSPTIYTIKSLEQNSYCSNEKQFVYQSCHQQCNSDDTCSANEYCSLGKCVPLMCDCGYIQDHTCINYECCSNTDCNESYKCSNHICIPINYSLQIENDNVSVGEDFTVTIFEESLPTADIELIVVYPNGTMNSFISNKDGKITIPALAAGAYLFYIKAVPDVRTYAYAYNIATQPQPKPPAPIVQPQPTKPQPQPSKCCFIGICAEFLGICWYWWIFSIMLFIIFYYLYKKIRKSRSSHKHFSKINPKLK